MARSEPTRLWRYGIALLAVSTAGLLTFLIGRVVQPVPLLLFLTSVAVSARFGGLGPGLLATVIGGMLSHFLLDRPVREALDGDPSGLYRLGLFTLLSVLISGIGENLRQAQRRLEESRQLFQNFMDHCPAVAFMKDQEGRYIYLNKPFQRAFPLAADGWQGKTDFELWAPRTALMRHDHDQAVLADNMPQEVLEPFTLDDRTSHWLTLRFPVHDRNGQTLLAGMAVDVTERMRLEEELKQRVAELAESDRRKDEFLAMLAHELRNPLAAISNANYVLAEASLPRHRVAHLRKVIEHQTQHLTRLVDDLLDVARITQGKVSLRRKRVELAPLVWAAVEGVRPLIDARRHALTVRLPEESAAVEVDPDRLEQVLANLLTNAARYTDPGGRIELQAEVAGAEIVVRVRDSGVGIAAEQLEQIFEPFRQGDAGIHQAAGGMGIGLALVRRLVEMHGGSVTAHSDGPGQGSEFRLRLPAVPATAVLPPREMAGTHSCERTSACDAAPLEALWSRRKVLVVDDNECAAETLAELLEHWGYEVQTRNNGEQALASASEWQPQVVLLDLQMPGMDGFEVARRLRQMPFPCRPQVVALTGCGPEVAARAHAAGFDNHMIKPVEPEALRRLLLAA